MEHYFLLLLLFVFLSALVGVKVQLGLSPRGNLVARVKDIDTLRGQRSQAKGHKEQRSKAMGMGSAHLRPGTTVDWLPSVRVRYTVVTVK